MKCTHCGTELPPDVTFCPNCGARVASSVGTPTIAMGQPELGAPPKRPDTDKLPDLDEPYEPPRMAAPLATYATSESTGVPRGSVPPHEVPPALPNSTAAVVSLVAGVLSWTLLPLGITGIVAVVAGHMAKNEIRRSGGQLGGNGMATAGLILGYAHLVLFLVAICAIAFGALVLLGAASS